MIIIISGGIGSGKSLTAVRYAVMKSAKNEILTNFTLKKVPYVQLSYNDIIKVETEGKKQVKKVNWDFWQNHKNSDVILDEAHEFINSRSSMSSENKMMTAWFSQARKIFGNKGDQNHINAMQRLSQSYFNKYFDKFMTLPNNMIFVTQKPRKIDVNLRELSHVFIVCQKKMINNIMFIILNCYFGNDVYDAVEAQELGQRPKRFIFAAKPFFKYYDSYELINFRR